MHVTQRHMSLDDALQRAVYATSLSVQDQKFAEYMIRGVLKHGWQLIPFISQFLLKPWSALPPQAQLLLLMAATQLHHMQVPAYAAVNTTIELAKRCKLFRLTGMMNVVLKQVSRSSAKEALQPYAKVLPKWYVNPSIKAYGSERAEQIMAHNMQDVGYLDLTIASASKVQHYADVFGGQVMSGQTVRIATGKPITEYEGYREGDWWVQDMAASLPIYGIRHILKDKQVLDVGAAPGGKTLQLCSYGAYVTALDRSEHRLQRLEENLERMNYDADIVSADVLTWTPPQQYDVIVLDAPCSATGTIRRNPDILYHGNTDTLAQRSQLQQRMLKHVCQWLKPEGYILYASCSLMPHEGEKVIEHMMQSKPELQIVPFEGIPEHLYNDEHYYRALPLYYHQQGGMDGFFAALLQYQS